MGRGLPGHPRTAWSAEAPHPPGCRPLVAQTHICFCAFGGCAFFTAALCPHFPVLAELGPWRAAARLSVSPDTDSTRQGPGDPCRPSSRCCVRIRLVFPEPRPEHFGTLLWVCASRSCSLKKNKTVSPSCFPGAFSLGRRWALLDSGLEGSWAAALCPGRVTPRSEGPHGPAAVGSPEALQPLCLPGPAARAGH